MNNAVLTILYDGASLKMPFRGGSVTLFADGTCQTQGTASADELIALFTALDTPPGGYVWWKLFAANALRRKDASEARRLANALGLSPNDLTLVNSDAMIDWIQTTELFKVISASVFIDIKARIWNAREDRPRRDSDAKKLLDFIFAHPNPARKTLKSL